MLRSTRLRSALCAFLALLVGVAAFTPAYAQNPHGSLGGTVRDSSGALVPAAKISVSNPELSLVQEGQTDAQGEFRIVDLPPGSYDVIVSANGFADAR